MATPFDAKIRELLSAETIARRVQEMGRDLSRAYAGKHPILVGTLKGSLTFLADLGRAMSVPVRYDYIGVSSYEGTESTGAVRLSADLSLSIEAQHIVLVDDIIDRGFTLRYLRDALGARKPASIAVVCLLDKPERRKVEVEVDYLGFVIPDEFVVGYGLDYRQYFRELPYIGVLTEIPELPA
jgi:hypoxanthine phosphoribosyltransferase